MACVQEFLIIGVKHALISQIAVLMETGNLLVLSRGESPSEELSNELSVVEQFLTFGLCLTCLLVLLLVTQAIAVRDLIEWVGTVGLRIEVILEAGHLWLKLLLLILAGHKVAEVRRPPLITISVFFRTSSHVEILCVCVLVVVVFIVACHLGSVRDELVEHLTCSSHALFFIFIDF